LCSVLPADAHQAGASALREHDSRRISLQQEESAEFFLLNVFSPAEVLASSC